MKTNLYGERLIGLLIARMPFDALPTVRLVSRKLVPQGSAASWWSSGVIQATPEAVPNMIVLSPRVHRWHVLLRSSLTALCLS
jgi:hypothetical protein